jgi:cystathionine gamma-lyase
MANGTSSSCWPWAGHRRSASEKDNKNCCWFLVKPTIPVAWPTVYSTRNGFLALRGLKTLALRMERHCQNAQRIAEWLAARLDVSRVHYPGLPTHPQHELARRQMSQFGGMVSVVLKGGEPRARQVLERCKLFTLAESLGGVESLIEHPGLMTHASIPADKRRQIGIDDGLVRLSVGIEDVNDLVADLDQALR